VTASTNGRVCLFTKARPLLWAISFGVATKRLDKHFHGNGDDEAWPFFKVEDFQMALKSPRYLNGSHNTALQPTPGGDAACLG